MMQLVLIQFVLSVQIVICLHTALLMPQEICLIRLISVRQIFSKSHCNSNIYPGKLFIIILLSQVLYPEKVRACYFPIKKQSGVRELWLKIKLAGV